MYYPELDYDYTMFVEENLPNTSTGTFYTWPELNAEYTSTSIADVADAIRREERIARAAVRNATRIRNERRAQSC